MLLPPGIHVWTSESLEFVTQYATVWNPAPTAFLGGRREAVNFISLAASTKGHRDSQTPRYPLNDHIIFMGPYTLVTVNEGYARPAWHSRPGGAHRATQAAVTQNNGKQVILAGGHSHFLNHKNWKFEIL